MSNGSPLIRFNTYATLSPTDMAALLPLVGTPRVLKKGDYLQHEGDETAGLFLLLAGWTASSMSLPDGERQMLKVHLAGDMIGLPSLPTRTAPDTVQALTAVTVSQIRLAAFGQLFVQSPRVAALLFLISQEERLMLMDRLTTVGRVNAVGRLAGLLLQLRGRVRRQNPAIGDTLSMPFSRRDLADLVGITTMHLYRSMQWLVAEKLIDYHRREITLRDPSRLRELSGLPERIWACDQDWLPQTDQGQVETGSRR